MRAARVYAGLSRPPQILGLPALPAMVVMALAGFSVMLIHWIVGAVVGVAAYGALKVLFEWEPQFPRILATVLVRTPPTRTRRALGGDRYGA